MKIRALLFATFMFAGLAGASTSGQEGTLDYFLPPPCGGGDPGPKPRPLAVTTETLRRHRIGGALPAYPEAAKKAGIQGIVSLNVKVDEQGNVSEVESWAGKPVMARVAVRAVKRWKYRPVLIEDEPFAFSGEVVFTFRLGKQAMVREGGNSPVRRVACTSSEGGLLYRVDPEYPRAARVAHVSGDVVLEIVINKQGRVEEVKATSGNPLLIQSAIDAVRQWRYQPYMIGNKAIPVQASVVLKFHM
jgi:TonB family protein